MRLPYRPRWLNHLYALLLGYFWLPCPLCGEDFGGHEWRTWGHTLYDGSRGIGTCPRCPVESSAGLTFAAALFMVVPINQRRRDTA